MALNRFHVVSPLALVAFSACRSPYIQGGAVNGAVVNGPLNSALVFLDYDFDGILDANEPNARTNEFGEYDLTATRDFYDLVAIADDQTVDTSSGTTFAGITLKAPSGAGVISPTSTLMKEGDLSAAEVAAVLGLPDGVDPLTFNPFNVDENDAAAIAQALEVAKISKQITTAISSFASATEGAGAGAADAFNTALNSVVDVVKAKAANANDADASTADKMIDFTETNDLDLIKTQVTSKATKLEGLDAATLNALAADTTAAVKNVNAKIKAVTDLSSDATKDIFSTTQVLRDQIKDVAVARKKGEAGEITFKNLAAVEAAMSNKAPEGIILSGDRLMSPDKGSLVVGKLATIDSDQGSEVAFTYTLAGKDADMFSFNASTGELYLKATPDYSKKPFYDVTIITKDEGGKKFAETFKIDVVPVFKGLAAPTSEVMADFEQTIKEIPLFKDMVDHVVLKQTPDGQLVLEEKGQGLSAEDSKPIMAIVQVTERGYELRNPANDQFMSGFFKYETGGLTYTGYEVFIPNKNMLGNNQKDLLKYFSADNDYGSKKLLFTDRDVDFISIASATVTDETGTVVSDMYGFNHYDKSMNILGSTGIDIANAEKPLYIETTGEFVPGLNSNITTTALTKANAELMKAAINKASGAVLYGEKETTFGKEHSHSETEDETVSENTIITSESENSGEVEVTEDISGPTITHFELKTKTLSLGESLKIEFNATDQTHVGYFNATFSDANNSSSKINIKGQHTDNKEKIADHFDFFLNSDNVFELNVPLIIDGELISGSYNLESLTLSDSDTKTDPVLSNESIYGQDQLDAVANQFFADLDSENKSFSISIPVLDDNIALPVINEVESNARLDLANQISPDNIVKGDVWPTGEDWFKFELPEPGTIIVQMDIGNRSADLKLYGPDEIEIVSKEVFSSGMIHHTTSELGDYYLLVGDGSANRSYYDLLVDII